MDQVLDRPASRPVPLVMWLVVLGVVVLLVTMLQGQVTTLHELVHDARHFVGVPCH